MAHDLHIPAPRNNVAAERNREMAHVELRGIVEREGEIFVARCWEVGTECCGATVEEALANLRELTWDYLARHPKAIQDMQ
jgi:hypothetical protein